MNYLEKQILQENLLPGAIALGSVTFTMTAIPGTPQIQNIIPTNYYGTDPTAAPVMGIIAAVLMFTLGVLWLQYRERKFTQAGDVFTEPKNREGIEVDYSALPNPFISFLPLITVIVTMNILKFDIIVSLICGIVLSMIISYNKYQGFTKSISSGATGSMTAILNTSAAVGFGTVVKTVPGFAALTEVLLNVPGTPLISEAIAVNLLQVHSSSIRRYEYSFGKL